MGLDLESNAYCIYLPKLRQVQVTHNVTIDKIKFFNINELEKTIINDLLNDFYPDFSSYNNDLDFDEVTKVTQIRALIIQLLGPSTTPSFKIKIPTYFIIKPLWMNYLCNTTFILSISYLTSLFLILSNV